MHYYQFNISDYQSHTKHLTPIEDICYRRLLDWQYMHEKPISTDIVAVCRLLMLRDYSTDVEQVLNEFFILTDDGWVNSRAFEEIEQYIDKSRKASEAGKASAAKRLSNKPSTNNQQHTLNSEQTFNDRSTTVQPTINQEPLTNNHKPITTNQEPLTTKPKSDSKESSLKPLSGVVAKSDIPPAEKIKPGEPITRETWKFYSEAYFLRYGAEPVRNATVTGQLAQFVKRIGKEESPYVAAFFVHHNNQFYVQKMHTVGLLLADAEKLRTEWATKKTVTQTQARRVDRTQSRGNVFKGLIDEAERNENNKNIA